MRAVGIIFRRELSSYFSTPIAIIFLTIFLVLNGVFTFKLGNFYESGQADLRTFFVWHPWLYLFIVPAVSMRLWAEERKTGTIELLLTLPVTLFEAMLGKFLAAWAFLGIALLLTFPIVFTTTYLGDPDIGIICAGYIGSFLMAGAYLSIGCWVSAMTSNQVISFVMATFICLLLILIGFEPLVDTLLEFFPTGVVEQISNLSFPYHFEKIQRGVIDFRDLVYFLSIMLFSLISGSIMLEKAKAD